MNAPVTAPKNNIDFLLLLGAFGLASLALIKLDGVLQDLESRVWRLEARGARVVPGQASEPEDAKPAGTEYAEELVNGNPVTPIRPAAKSTRSRTVRAAKPAEGA